MRGIFQTLNIAPNKIHQMQDFLREILLEEILHQLIVVAIPFFIGFWQHPRWFFRISEPSTVSTHFEFTLSDSTDSHPGIQSPPRCLCPHPPVAVITLDPKELKLVASVAPRTRPSLRGAQGRTRPSCQ